MAPHCKSKDGNFTANKVGHMLQAKKVVNLNLYYKFTDICKIVNFNICRIQAIIIVIFNQY